MKKFAKLTLIASIITIPLAFLTVKGLELLQSTVVEGTFISEKGIKAVGAGLAVGLAGTGAGIGMGTASSAAIGAISEDPNAFSTSIIFIVLIEAVAIYGLLIALLLIFV